MQAKQTEKNRTVVPCKQNCGILCHMHVSAKLLRKKIFSQFFYVFPLSRRHLLPLANREDAPAQRCHLADELIECSDTLCLLPRLGEGKI